MTAYFMNRVCDIKVVTSLIRIQIRRIYTVRVLLLGGTRVWVYARGFNEPGLGSVATLSGIFHQGLGLGLSNRPLN